MSETEKAGSSSVTGGQDLDPVPDELIMKQQSAIDSEISAKTPLVGPKEPLGVLLTEYAADAVYRDKILELTKTYAQLRRMRPDGNCFFRAYSYAALEGLLGKIEEAKAFRNKVTESREKLTQAGFVQFTIDEFYEHFLNMVDKVIEGLESDGLEREFGEDQLADYLVVYLRILTSAELKNSSDFYSNFIEERSLEEFCQLEVEPMYKESDHIHIIALTAALGLGVRVVYMDRGAGAQHDFPESQTPTIHLLYRPGHYDILYPTE